MNCKSPTFERTSRVGCPAAIPFASEGAGNPLRMDANRQKLTGAYLTPEGVVKSLVRWAVRRPTDRLLDPSCGDGRFLREHRPSMGIEQDPGLAAVAHRAAPGSLVREGDFFTWAAETNERFECAAGNPPFIRYQRFSGEVRERARRLCQGHGVSVSALSSSWAPFLISTVGLVKEGGRMAFVVPAEIGHAPYARPVLQYLMCSFGYVHVLAIKNKIFSGLSEACWLLFASGRGRQARQLSLSVADSYESSATPPKRASANVVTKRDLDVWDGRLRPFLLDREVRDSYLQATKEAVRLGDLATVGIGYVTGANDFFHLRPSQARRLRLPERHLAPSIRYGRLLNGKCLTRASVMEWHRADEPYLLLRLSPDECFGRRVTAYLESAHGLEARRSFKCQSRDPWYSVPNVRVPCGFLSYMSGAGPSLVENSAGCVGTNSVHVVHLKQGVSRRALFDAWGNDLTALSCEIEGHPLGGGLLKLEPTRAARVLIDRQAAKRFAPDVAARGLATMRFWRGVNSD